MALTLCAGTAAQAQEKPASPPRQLAPVTVSASANRDPVEKSYRKMTSGMDLFDRERAALAPDALLRFKLLPRKPDTDMNNIDVEVIGSTEAFPVPVAPDHTFSLPRNRQAQDENAQVIPNRKSQSMTWRTDIRSSGVPAGMRRLGDLRLECRVGMQAGLISNGRSFIGRMAKAVMDTPGYCDGLAPKYLFFAERPVFSVTLAAGERREILALEKLYGSASDDPSVQQELAYCDCEVLLDRAYVLPLGDRRWPDSTLVEFDYMEGP
ncbi:MAG: hypothetical protein Q7T87_15620 [Polaromonas sp.]|nr:hypothetical protein [Polaromonas sp.]